MARSNTFSIALPQPEDLERLHTRPYMQPAFPGPVVTPWRRKVLQNLSWKLFVLEFLRVFTVYQYTKLIQFVGSVGLRYVCLEAFKPSCVMGP